MTGVDHATRRASERLADEMRRLIARLAVLRPPAEELERAVEEAEKFADMLDGLAERTSTWQISEAGLQPGDFVAFSPVGGRSNPIAPPVRLRIVEDDEHRGRVVGSATFGPAYEGPPGHVHGGLVAAMYDELLGFAQLEAGFTAYLKVDYRRPTPLNQPLELTAWVDSVDGRKRIIRGTCTLGGAVLSEAEGLFIAPKSEAEYLVRLAKQP
jgi:acyl-coenzyme A thioesterase PaaI-like protein